MGGSDTGLQLRMDTVDGQYVAQLFKWIKQHLRIKAFFGTTENAVKAQIWIAVSVYVLVAIIKKRLNLSASLYEILQILSLRHGCDSTVSLYFSAKYEHLSET
jgi:high-affinity nickel permease